MGQLASPEALTPERKPHGYLVGMLTKNPKRHHILVAIKIGTILKAIDRSAL
jgi:hypothetical protein